MINKKRVGLLTFTLELPDSLQYGMDYFFSQIMERGIYTNIGIEISYCTKLPYIVDINDFITINMKNINYYYNKNQHLYIAENDYAYGIIDCEKEHCKWYILETFKNIRSIFHTCILDPLSLLGVRYGFIVLHAAMVEYKNRGIIFMGKSRAGKSTISMLIAKKSNEFLKYSTHKEMQRFLIKEVR